MPNKNLRLCLGCMNYIDKEIVVCSICNTSKFEENREIFLKRGSSLNNKFIIGKALKSNGEHVIYIAKDNKGNKRHFIKEYAPKLISERNQNGEVIPQANCEVQYKTFMTDFWDANQALRQLNSIPGLLKIENIIINNKTVYVIYEYKQLMPLSKYFEIYQSVEWNTCKAWIFSLNKLLVNIHNNGIIHRGISPETIYFDKHKNVILWDFLTPCFCTKTTQLIYQLFDGFSAPEQYYANKWQGEWTDVYSMACVVLRMLTGQKYMDLPSNFFDGRNELNKDIPENVLETLGKALKSDCKERIQTIKQFNAGLMNEYITNSDIEKDKTIFFDVNEQKSKYELPIPHIDEGSEIKGIFKILLFMCIGFVLVGVIASAIIYFIKKSSPNKLQKLDTEDTQQEKNTDRQQLKKIPNFMGENYDKICKDINSKFKVSASLVFDEVVPKGMIVSQTPQPGTNYNEKELIEIKLTVSKGVKIVLMPNIIGKNIKEAEEQLSELNIQYERVYLESDDAEPDIVFKTNKDANEEVKVKKEKIMLYLKKTDNLSTS